MYHRRRARVIICGFTARAHEAATDGRAFGSHTAKPADLKKPWGVEEYCRLIMEEGQGEDE